MAERARLLLFHVVPQVALELRPPVILVAFPSGTFGFLDASVVSRAIRIHWAALALTAAAAAIVIRIQ